jgi:hypothetical protein
MGWCTVGREASDGDADPLLTSPARSLLATSKFIRGWNIGSSPVGPPSLRRLWKILARLEPTDQGMVHSRWRSL